jgi:hypothetical protein
MFPNSNTAFRGGKSVAFSCPYRGEWVLENVLFLYQPVDPPASFSVFGFTAGFQIADGRVATGFDAGVIAARLDITIEDLFIANRSGMLGLAGVQGVPPEHEGFAAKLYAFMLGDSATAMQIEVLQPPGSA